jgi:uncharacterized protein (TIGR00725 family)
MTSKKGYKYSICVSGAAAGDTVDLSAGLARRVGVSIAKHGHVTTTGATVGLPYFAAKAASEHGGLSIGYSPARNVREHVAKYRLPIDGFDYINYTGMAYVGRDQYLIQSSDAVITVGGRFGSLHEFVTALESHRPCGVLLHSGGTADIISELIKVLDPGMADLVIFDENPENLVARMVAILDDRYVDIQANLAQNPQWYLGKDHKG